MRSLLRPFVSSETVGQLLYQLGLGVLGSVALALIIAGWAVAICVAITPLVVPVLIGFGLGVGVLAAAEAHLARELLGVNVNPAVGVSGTGFWARGFTVLRSGAFWRQQAHLLLGWCIAILALCPLSLGIQTLAIPLYYDRGDGTELLWEKVDTFRESLVAIPVGLALIAIGVLLLGPVTGLSRRLARTLLAGEGERVVRSAAEVSAIRMRALTIAALAATTIAATLIVIWWVTTAGYFWPIWPLLSFALVLGISGWVVLVLERPEPARYALGSRALAIQIGVSVIIAGILVAIWAITTSGYFWPIWPAIGLAVVAGLSAAAVYGQREHRIRRLEETRAGAVDVQESELRRIERDLHDGAQARLVALGMSLGRAEQALDKDPEAVRQLLAEARKGAGEALVELRDLARGIRPPILTDRGLGPALEALGARTPIPVKLSVDLDRPRYESAVETAAYFTVAEALANAIKHAKATRVDIRIESQDGVLVAEVTDDGEGGADPSGFGLVGLRQRAEALDGTLRVKSPPGGPTTVTVEIPCG